MTQDNESAFGRGFRNGYGASDATETHYTLQRLERAQKRAEWDKDMEAIRARHAPPSPSPVDYTMPILCGCLTALLIALVLAMAWRRKA